MSEQTENHALPPLSPEERAQQALQAGLNAATVTGAEITRRDEDGQILSREDLGDVSAESTGDVSTEGPGDLPAGGTAHEKIMQTLRTLSEVEEDAGELELMLASLAIALERGLGDQLHDFQGTGELDEFMAALVRWIATLTSDNRPRLIVVPIPRRALRPEQKLHLLLHAEQQYEQAARPI